MVIKKTSSEFHNWDEDGSNNKALAKRNLNIFIFTNRENPINCFSEIS